MKTLFGGPRSSVFPSYTKSDNQDFLTSSNVSNSKQTNNLGHSRNYIDIRLSTNLQAELQGKPVKSPKRMIILKPVWLLDYQKNLCEHDTLCTASCNSIMCLYSSRWLWKRLFEQESDEIILWPVFCVSLI